MVEGQSETNTVRMSLHKHAFARRVVWRDGALYHVRDASRTLALPSPLVHVSRRVVEHAEHGHDAVGGAVGPADVARLGADVVDGQADPAWWGEGGRRPTGVSSKRTAVREGIRVGSYRVVPSRPHGGTRVLKIGQE